MSDSYIEDNGNQGDDAGENSCRDESDIAGLIESAQNNAEALNRQPHRYRKLLDVSDIHLNTESPRRPLNT